MTHLPKLDIFTKMARKRLLLLILVFLIIPAWGKLVVLENININLHIKEDATLDIIEEHDYLYDGDFTGGSRTIKLEGLESISDVLVKEGDFEYIPGSLEKFQFQTAAKINGLAIEWTSRRPIDPEYKNTRKKMTIQYKAHGAFRFYGNYDELYWRVLDEARDGMIKKLSVKMYFPTDIDRSKVSASIIYNGQAEVKFIGENILGFSAINVGPSDSFDIKVGIPMGVIERIGFLKIQNMPLYTLFVIPFAVFFVVLFLYLRFEMGYEFFASKKKNTSRPADLMPAVSALIIDEKPDIRQVVATIYDLARRGYIEINKNQNDFEIKLIKFPVNLEEYEVKFLKAMFGDPAKEGNIINASSFKLLFSKYIPDLKEAIDDEAVKLGYFYEDRLPFKRRIYYFGWAISILMLAVCGFFNLKIILFFAPLVLFAGLLGCSLKGKSLVFSAALMMLAIIVLLARALAIGIIEQSLLLVFLISIIISGLIIVAFSGGASKKNMVAPAEKRQWLAYKRFLAGNGSAALEKENLPYSIAFGVVKNEDTERTCQAI